MLHFTPDFDGIYYNEEQEYAYPVLNGKKPMDVSRLEEASIYLDAKEVSELYRCVWESNTVLSEENWENLFIYSDEELTSRYLLKALQDGASAGFNSRILAKIAPYISEENLTNILLALGKVALTFPLPPKDMQELLYDKIFKKC